MSSDIAIRPDQSGFDDAQIAALRALGVENAPVGDLDLFFHQAARLGLDPFAKQIYLIGRNTKVSDWSSGKKVEKWVVKYTIQTGIDGFRVIRSRPHDHAYLGQKEEWCGPDGVWRDVWLADEPPAAAKVSLFIDGYLQPIVGIARYVEYVQTTSGGEPNSMWKKMPAGQLAKCAEALATRKAYPNDLSGVYTDDEMGQADNVSGTTLIASKPGAQRVDQRTGEVQDQPAPPRFDPSTWEDRIADALGDLDDLRRLHKRARDEHAIDQKLSNGETVGKVLEALAARLKAEQDQQPTEEPV
ncbi:MAG: recombinase RecT [Acidobacteria bacterium]|nr:recombinase RecT [Acidobacteriota bacterium]